MLMPKPKRQWTAAPLDLQHTLRRWLTGPCGVFLALAVIGIDTLALYGYLSRRLFLLSPVWIYLCLYTTLFGLYVYAAGRLLPRLPREWSRHAFYLIFGLGILFRLVSVTAQPSLSTDIYLYCWDGRLILHGINPYHWAPNAHALRSLRDPLWEKMEYKSFQSIYMPVSQGFFALNNALFGNALIGYKLVYTLFDIGVMGIVTVLLRALRRPVTQIIWYAWCPLPITETALSGHQDMVGVFFLMLGLAMLRSKKWQMWAAVPIAAAVMTKGFALMLLPLLWRRCGRRFVLVFVVSLLYFALPLLVYLPNFLHGMTQYVNDVHANAGLFDWVNHLLIFVTPYHFEITNRLADFAVLAAAIWAAWRPVASYAVLLRRAFFVLAVTLLVLPTLFPWYLVWILPLLPLAGKRISPAFVLLSGLMIFLYTYYISIMPYPWTSYVEYLPFYAVFAWEWRTRRGLFSRSAPANSASIGSSLDTETGTLSASGRHKPAYE